MSLAKLVAYRLKIALASLTRGRASRRIGRTVGIAMILVLAVFLTMGAYAVFTILARMGEAGAVTSSVIVLLTFNIILILALVFDILTTTGIFFLSSDLSLLMAAPVPVARVFGVKYLEAMASASFVSLLIGFPVVLGYGIALHASAVFFIALVVVTGVFITIPISVGTICGMVVSRFVPAARVREVLAVLSGMIGLGIWIAVQVFKPAMARTSDVESLSVRLQAFVRGGGGLLAKLPSRYPAEILTSLATGKSAAAVRPSIYLIALAGIMLAASLAAAQRMYLTGWTRIVPAGKRSKPARRRERPALGWQLVPSAERSILRTTTQLFLRDPQQMMPVATLTIMMAILPFLMGRGSQFGGLRPGMIIFAATALAFVGSLNLAMNAVVIDGRAFWWLLAAPRSSLRKLAAKSQVAVNFFVILTWALLAGFCAAHVIPWHLALKAAWLSAFSTVLGAAIGVPIGLTFADWEWELPKRMVKMAGRFVLILAGGAYIVGAGALLGVFSATKERVANPEIGWLHLLALGAGAAILAAAALLISARKMDKMEWTL
ncbi:MAG TPA: hypothetical protein VMU02_05430 [bacterium]|nr:hypothetical protein [bacterium]